MNIMGRIHKYVACYNSTYGRLPRVIYIDDSEVDELITYISTQTFYTDSDGRLSNLPERKELEAKIRAGEIRLLGCIVVVIPKKEPEPMAETILRLTLSLSSDGSWTVSIPGGCYRVARDIHELPEVVANSVKDFSAALATIVAPIDRVVPRHNKE